MLVPCISMKHCIHHWRLKVFMQNLYVNTYVYIFCFLALMETYLMNRYEKNKNYWNYFGCLCGECIATCVRMEWGLLMYINQLGNDPNCSHTTSSSMFYSDNTEMRTCHSPHYIFIYSLHHNNTNTFQIHKTKHFWHLT